MKLRLSKKKINYKLKYNEEEIVKIYQKTLSDDRTGLFNRSLAESMHPLIRYATAKDKKTFKVPLKLPTVAFNQVKGISESETNIEMLPRNGALRETTNDNIVIDNRMKSTNRVKRRRAVKADEEKMNWTTELAMNLIFNNEEENQELKLGQLVTEKEADKKKKELVQIEEQQITEKKKEGVKVAEIGDYKNEYKAIMVRRSK